MENEKGSMDTSFGEIFLSYDTVKYHKNMCERLSILGVILEASFCHYTAVTCLVKGTYEIRILIHIYCRMFEFLCIKIGKFLIGLKYSVLIYTCNEGKVGAVNNWVISVRLLVNSWELCRQSLYFLSKLDSVSWLGCVGKIWLWRLNRSVNQNKILGYCFNWRISDYFLMVLSLAVGFGGTISVLNGQILSDHWRMQITPWTYELLFVLLHQRRFLSSRI